MNIHFLSGLPRSGSTLLAAILQQNPFLQTSIISPLAGLVNAAQRATAANQETSVFVTDVDRMRILEGLFSAYYADCGQSAILDSNRAWTGKLPLLVQLFPDFRMVCCVREPAWIMDSLEKLLQKYPLQLNGIFKFYPAMNVFDRADFVAPGDGIIGYPLNALKEAYFGPHADRLLLVEYDALTSRPIETVDAVYEWLSIPRYKHDFDNVRQIPGASEFDAKLGAPGLHTVGKRVHITSRATSLPPELFARFAHPFWHKPNGRSKVIVAN
jgi:sulfotransferase